MDYVLLYGIIFIFIGDIVVKNSVKLFIFMDFMFWWILGYYNKDMFKVRVSKRVWEEVDGREWENVEIMWYYFERERGSGG